MVATTNNSQTIIIVIILGSRGLPRTFLPPSGIPCTSSIVAIPPAIDVVPLQWLLRGLIHAKNNNHRTFTKLSDGNLIPKKILLSAWSSHAHTSTSLMHLLHYGKLLAAPSPWLHQCMPKNTNRRTFTKLSDGTQSTLVKTRIDQARADGVDISTATDGKSPADAVSPSDTVSMMDAESLR